MIVEGLCHSRAGHHCNGKCQLSETFDLYVGIQRPNVDDKNIELKTTSHMENTEIKQQPSCLSSIA